MKFLLIILMLLFACEPVPENRAKEENAKDFECECCYAKFEHAYDRALHQEDCDWCE